VKIIDIKGVGGCREGKGKEKQRKKVTASDEARSSSPNSVVVFLSTVEYLTVVV